MKLRHQLLFMVDLLLERKRNLVISISMMSCTFLLFLLVLTLLSEMGYDIRQYKNCFREGTEHTFHVQINEIPEEAFENMDFDFWTTFLQRLENTAGAKKLGRYSVQTVRIPELYRNPNYLACMQGSFSEVSAGVTIEGSSRVVMADSEMFEIVNSSWSEKLPYDWDDMKKETAPVIVGAALSDVLGIGSRLHLNGIELVVTGYTEKGEKWPADGIISGNYNRLENLDYCLIVPLRVATRSGDEMVGVNSLYYLADRKNAQKTRSEIDRIAGDLGMSVVASSIDNQMSVVYRDRIEAVKTYRGLLCFMIAMCLCAGAGASVIACMTRLREIGIWYANGILPADVSSMIFWEQTVKVTVAATLAYCLGMLGEMSIKYRQLYRTSSLGWLVVLAVAVLIITAAIPMLYMRKKQPVQLIQAKG